MSAFPHQIGRITTYLPAEFCPILDYLPSLLHIIPMKNKTTFLSCILTLLSALLALPGRAEADGYFMSPGSNPSISELLNPDGTLNLYTGYTGSLNLTGFSVVLDPEKGISASTATEQEEVVMGTWSALGAGTSGTCYAVAVQGTDVYVGGSFANIGGLSASCIAKWDGSTWSVLGSGLNNACWEIAFSETGELYAGGSFTTAGGISANRIAKWDGSTWSALGTGLVASGTAQCYTMAIVGTDLYAAGIFTTAGGVSANNIAKWNGATWSALGGGLTGGANVCNAIIIQGTNLYAGGNFTVAGGAPAAYVAKWNGTTWSALGSGLNTYAQSFAVSGTDLYVSGNFTTAGGLSVGRIAKWNGSTWSALGTGLGGIATGLIVSGTDLYAGGTFSTAGAVSAAKVAKWDGTAWSALGAGLSGGFPSATCWAIAGSGTDLYAAGSFSVAGSVSASGIARWDGLTALPVELIDFSGRIQNNHTYLFWQTASETRNKGFDIEHSPDGYDWIRIGFVPGLGDGDGLQAYDFTDEKPLPGQNYYRLKQWDLDGRYEYSNAVSLTLPNKDKQTGAFYPNPARSGLVSLEYYAEKEADLLASVFDATGRLVLRRTQALEEDRNVLQFDFSQLTAGTYSVHLDDGTNRIVRNITIE